VYYRVLIEGLEDDTEVDLAQDEHDNWKLGYVQTPDESWTVIDLGHFDDEGELFMAADDRLAELLEWPELAEERRCCDGEPPAIAFALHCFPVCFEMAGH
jgi:hypothetical protein